MSVLTPHRFTVEDYYRMAEVGILKPDAKVELIDGEIIDMLPAGPFHSGSIDHLVLAFSDKANGRWITSSQRAVRLNQESEPEPDVVLLKTPLSKYKRAHPVAADVYLVVEVADSSLSYDRTKKLQLYATGGIPEVWILNIPQRVLEVYRSPTGLRYQDSVTLHDGSAAPLAFPDAEIDVAELLR